MRIPSVLLLSLLMIPWQLLGQDERFFRQFISGELVKNQKALDNEEFLSAEYKWKTNTPFYRVDMNDDGNYENFLYEKRDGEDWFHVYNSLKKRIASFKFETQGANSSLFKILIKQLSEKTKLYVLFFYEGYTEFFEFQGTVRLYFLTVEDRDLNRMYWYKGPAVFEELKTFRKHYSLRSFKIKVMDYDGDGLAEVAIRYHLVSHVYHYRGKGEWRTLGD